MEKTQFVEQMKLQMDSNLQELYATVPHLMSDENTAIIIKECFIKGYMSGMNNMFNIIQDEFSTVPS